MINQREMKLGIAEAAKTAQSDLAKFVFDKANYDKFTTIFSTKPPTALVIELNKIKNSPSDLEQFKKIINKQKEYPELFALPPNKWFEILINGNIYEEDLKGIFTTGSLMSKVLQTIDKLPDTFEKGQLLHYLGTTPDIDGKEIIQFLKSVKCPAMIESELKQSFLKLHQLLREKANNMVTTSMELQLKVHSPLNLEPRTQAMQNLIRECIFHAQDKLLIKLIDIGANDAKSTVAKFVFNPNNIEKTGALLTVKRPKELVAQLNKENISKEQLDQLNIISSNQREYASLFKLPAEKWFDILIHEKIESEDLLALIGSSDVLEGAISGALNEIKEFPTILDRARVLYYLTISKDDSDLQIKSFLQTLHLPKTTIESFQNTFLHLHHILHNVREPLVHEGPFQTVLARPATEGILRIHPPEPLADDLKPEVKAALEKKNEQTIKNNEARINAALRIMKECVTNMLDKTVRKLSTVELKKFQEEQSELYAKQLDEEAAKQLNQLEHGELSARSVPESKMPIGSHQLIFISGDQGADTFEMLFREISRDPSLFLSRMDLDNIAAEEQVSAPSPAPGTASSTPIQSAFNTPPVHRLSPFLLQHYGQPTGSEMNPYAPLRLRDLKASFAHSNNNQNPSSSSNTILRSLSPLHPPSEIKREIKQEIKSDSMVQNTAEDDWQAESLISQQEALLRFYKESKSVPEDKIDDNHEILDIDGQRFMLHK